MKRVTVVQRRMTHYRVPLFERMRENLSASGVELRVLMGQGTTQEEAKRDSAELPWGGVLPTHYFADGRLCWQPFGEHLADTELVIVTQENKLLYNHSLVVMPRQFKLAFWGHGGNLQSGNPRGLKERFKRWTTNRADWWFAYTDMSAGLVAATGFPDKCITVLNNAVDTSGMKRHRESIGQDELRAIRTELEFGDAPLGAYIGSLYADKRLDFLFDAAEAIRAHIPDFRLLIVGDGPEREKVRDWCSRRQWARWVGARFGREKVAYLSAAKLLLNPGLVGLGILDSFVCGVPMVTTDCGIHSPEIAYLENGANGVVTMNDVHAYAEACIGLLKSPDVLSALQAGCADSAGEYTLENMARRFTDGIERALSPEAGP